MASRTERSTPEAMAAHRSTDWIRKARSIVLLAPVFAAGLLVSCVGDVPAVPTNDPVLVQGRDVYSRNCVGCHGASGQGGTGTKLNEGTVVEKYPDPADQAVIIAEGRNQMPAFEGKLSPEEIDAVVRFTREGL